MARGSPEGKSAGLELECAVFAWQCSRFAVGFGFVKAAKFRATDLSAEVDRKLES